MNRYRYSIPVDLLLLLLSDMMGENEAHPDLREFFQHPREAFSGWDISYRIGEDPSLNNIYFRVYSVSETDDLMPEPVHDLGFSLHALNFIAYILLTRVAYRCKKYPDISVIRTGSFAALDADSISGLKIESVARGMPGVVDLYFTDDQTRAGFGMTEISNTYLKMFRK